MSTTDIEKSTTTKTKEISPTLSNLIAEANYTFGSFKEKILAAYNYAVQKDGFTPKEAAKLLRERLDFSDSYIRKVLPLESKETEKTTKKSIEDKINGNGKDEDAIQVSHNLQETEENVVNILTEYDIKEADTEPIISELEKFRQERGKVVQQQEQEQEQEEEEQRDVITYDNPEKIIKQYEELEQKYDKVIMSYEVKDVIIAPNGQEIPIIIEVDPYMRTAKSELDQKEIKKLGRF